MGVSKQSDESFFRLLLQMNRLSLDKLPTNLKAHELAALFIIDECNCDKDGVYVSEIAESLRIPMSGVSRILKRLESELHYIVRRPDTKDRRNTLVSLTKEGKDNFDQNKALAIDFAKKVFNYLTPEEQHQYLQISEKLKKASDIEFANLYQHSL